MSEARIAEPSARAQLDEIADDVSCGATGPSDLVAKAMELIDEARTERQRSDELLVQAHTDLCEALDVRHRPLLDVIQYAAIVRAERDRLAEQAERDRASIVRLAQSWARRGKGALAAELLTEFEMDEGEVLGAEAGR